MSIVGFYPAKVRFVQKYFLAKTVSRKGLITQLRQDEKTKAPLSFDYAQDQRRLTGLMI
jgi:hypothetical protein